MKRKISLLVVMVVLSCGMTSCALFSSMTKKEVLGYNNDRPLFVGVHQGLNTDQTVTVFPIFDVLKNEYKGFYHFKTKNLATLGLTYSLCRATVDITVTKNDDGLNIINVKASDPKLEDTETKDFKDYNLNLPAIENEVSKQIIAQMNVSDEEFNLAMDKTISNLNFLYSVCYGMNSIAFNKWLNDIKIYERELEFKLPMYGIEESKSNNYKYNITGIFTPKVGKKSYYTDPIYVEFQTSDDTYINYRKGDEISMKGKIISIKQNKFGSGYTILMKN